MLPGDCGSSKRSKQQGVLNDDEYAAQRKRILDFI